MAFIGRRNFGERPLGLIERLEQRSKPFLFTLGLLLVVLQSLINYLAGADFSFVLFYLLPVSLAAWLISRRAGVVISLASAVGYFVTETLLSEHFHEHPLIPYFNVLTRLATFLFVTSFVSALRRSHDHERELARTDDLTGVINRRSFFEAAQLEISRARRHKRPFTVAYMDVDDFKLINDRFGHSVGDTVLRTVSQTIKRTIRGIDVVARLGGDEFVILMPETDEEAAQIVVNRVHHDIMRTIRENRWPITFSVGVVTWTTPPRTVDVMLKQADDAMYQVKNNGKNKVSHLKMSGEPVAAT
ncbi:MAG TPA: diguanylate cyclase [Pyrinomonadaceae bacterium]|nr:diguanylate cyclase [Pyrinomonadaceae bacterium]